MLDDVQAIWAKQREIQIIKWSPIPIIWVRQLDVRKVSTATFPALAPRHLCTFALDFPAVQSEVTQGIVG